MIPVSHVLLVLLFQCCVRINTNTMGGFATTSHVQVSAGQVDITRTVVEKHLESKKIMVNNGISGDKENLIII